MSLNPKAGRVWSELWSHSNCGHVGIHLWIGPNDGYVLD